MDNIILLRIILKYENKEDEKIKECAAHKYTKKLLWNHSYILNRATKSQPKNNSNNKLYI